MTAKPETLGTVNGFISTPMTVNGKREIFDGTTKGMTNAAYALGVRPGQTIEAWGMTYVMVSSGGGTRTPNGVWFQRVSMSIGRVAS